MYKNQWYNLSSVGENNTQQNKSKADTVGARVTPYLCFNLWVHRRCAQSYVKPAQGTVWVMWVRNWARVFELSWEPSTSRAWVGSLLKSGAALLRSSSFPQLTWFTRPRKTWETSNHFHIQKSCLPLDLNPHTTCLGGNVGSAQGENHVRYSVPLL